MSEENIKFGWSYSTWLGLQPKVLARKDVLGDADSRSTEVPSRGWKHFALVKSYFALDRLIKPGLFGLHGDTWLWLYTT